MALTTASEETRRLVMAAAAACEDKKAEETRILKLDPADASFTDFFLITSGTNERQTQAIADEVELRLKREFNTYANSVEGRRQGEWILMDYVDFVVHIFLAEKRAYYDIERLRKSAKPVDVEQLKAALAKKVANTREKAARKAAVKKSAAKKTARTAGETATKKRPAKKAAAKAGTRRPAVKKAAGKKTISVRRRDNSQGSAR